MRSTLVVVRFALVIFSLFGFPTCESPLTRYHFNGIIILFMSIIDTMISSRVRLAVNHRQPPSNGAARVPCSGTVRYTLCRTRRFRFSSAPRRVNDFVFSLTHSAVRSAERRAGALWDCTGKGGGRGSESAVYRRLSTYISCAGVHKGVRARARTKLFN